MKKPNEKDLPINGKAARPNHDKSDLVYNKVMSQAEKLKEKSRKVSAELDKILEV